MTAGRLISALENDPMARLKWRVMERLGICPVSLRALLLTRRKTIACACQLALDAGAARTEPAAEENPSFDLARFRALSENGGGGR